LTASSNNFVQNAAGCLRARIGIDDLISPPPERKANTEKFIRLLMHGKILSGSEFMLLGTGGAELFSAFKEVPMTDAAFLRGQSTLQVLSFACKLSDTTTPKNFFEECEEQMRTWRREKRDIGRALLCCASIDNDDIFCGDVEKAFSQAHIDHEIYFEPPPQLNMKGKVIKALMSIEGLPQSGWLFQNESFAKIQEKLAYQSGKFRQRRKPTETAGSSALAFGTSVQSSASRVEGDRTGTFDAYTRTLLAAHVSDSTNVSTIQNLGERMSSMPRMTHCLKKSTDGGRNRGGDCFGDLLLRKLRLNGGRLRVHWLAFESVDPLLGSRSSEHCARVARAHERG
jgi:hypothetical protein